MSRKIGPATLAVFLVCVPAFAQGMATVPPADLSGPQAYSVPRTLDLALKSISLDPGEFALAVGADRLPLPQDAPSPGPRASVTTIATDFGQAAHRFGPVLAIAPPTMIVLNTRLKPPLIFDGMPTGDAVKLLTATLTPTQWNALTSPQGLGLADLTGPDQLALFRACLGTGSMKAYSTSGSAPQTVDAATDLPQARLRLGSKSDVELPVSDHEWRGSGAPPDAAAPPRYTMARSDQATGDTLYGNVIKTDVPNKPKPGNLDFSAPSLRVSVPTNGLTTVGDLVARIGALTKLELYADPHYSGKSVTLVTGASGANSAVPLPLAGDLLRALAFCLTATYRQVGPAYVLTDDLAGLGVRRLLFSDQDALAQRLRQKPLDAAGDIITAQHGLADLHPYEGGADQAPTPAEVLKAQSDDYSMDPPGMYLHLSFADLTPAQQAVARASAAQAATEQGTRPLSNDEQHLPSLEGTLLLVTQPTLELLVPSVPGPIDIGSYDMQSLFRPSQKTLDAQREARSKADNANPPATAPVKKAMTPPPAPSLAQVFAGIPRRAALVNARTPADVDAAVASMKALGLNQLWLTVFTNGEARIPGTPFSAANTPDVLSEARQATQGTDIAVYPVLDLLTWGPEAPADAQDVTLRGDNSTQALLRQYQGYQDDQDTAAHEPITLDPAQKRLIVSPFAPSVQDALQTLIRVVGAAPGIAGIVWRETAPAGYAASRESGGSETFGYSLDGRLASLRRAHVDPIDIDSSGSRADSSLPNWDENAPDEVNAWNNFRVDTDVRLLQALLADWPARGLRPVLVEQRRDSWEANWFGSWDGPRSPLPAYHPSWEQQPNDPAYPEEPGRQAKMQSKTALLRVDSQEASRPSTLASYLNDHFKDRVKAPWDGFVLEFDGEGDTGVKSLQSLAEDLSANTGSADGTPGTMTH